LRPNQKVHFELGRAVVAQCGTLISKVLYIKKGVNTNFAILDAGMTELMRPALYQAYHKIENGSEIIVPVRRKYRWTPAERIAVSTGVVSVATLIFTIFNATRP